MATVIANKILHVVDEDAELIASTVDEGYPTMIPLTETLSGVKFFMHRDAIDEVAPSSAAFLRLI